VTRINEGSVVPAPDEVRTSSGEAITGIGRHGDRLVLMLELERILNTGA
jgi:chemotaxis signal transduction protein